MKKIIYFFIAGFIIGLLISPVAGMANSVTRNLILGMASDVTILAMADKVNDNKNSDEQLNTKISDLQSIVDNQKTELANCQQQIDLQSAKIEESDLKNEGTQIKINNEVECRKLYSDNQECNTPSFRSELDFNRMIESYKEGMPDKWKSYRDEKLIVFKKCQEIIKECG
ncbi:MAG: hypothetical protein WC819_04985 [Parcubacteria group bacterium]|jgi:hypothetical protein